MGTITNIMYLPIRKQEYIFIFLIINIISNTDFNILQYHLL